MYQERTVYFHIPTFVSVPLGICTVDFICSRIRPVDTVSKRIEVQRYYVAHISIVDIGGRDALRSVPVFPPGCCCSCLSTGMVLCHLKEYGTIVLTPILFQFA